MTCCVLILQSLLVLDPHVVKVEVVEERIAYQTMADCKAAEKAARQERTAMGARQIRIKCVEAER